MQTDVLIVGAGPTGLALACQLIRYGVDFVIIDKKETTTPHSKAIGVQARTLELYEQIGLANKLIELGAKAERATMFAGGKIRGQVEFRDLGAGLSPYPYVLIVEQGKHEALLYDYIKSHGKEVRWQSSLESFTQDADGVAATFVDQNGEMSTVTAKYLIGCDGAKSPVRRALGLTFEGSTFERVFYVADVDIDWEFEHGGLHVFLMKNSLLAVFSMSGDRQYRIVGTFPEEFAKDEGEVLYDEIEERIRLDAEIDFDITKVNWFSTYKVHTRHVNKFSEGRCFLAGDSAHIHTPAGAQGMNTGIQDGYNLAWKLALVVKHGGSANLLDTYNEERLPNAENLMKTTDRFFNLVASPNPFLVFARIYIFPYIANLMFSLDAVKRFVFPRISQIAINYRGKSLSKTNGAFKVKAGDRMPWFEIDGSSVYGRLDEPGFHLLLFLDEKVDVPPLPTDLMKHWRGLVDTHIFSLDEKVADTFGTAKPFFVLLRPDNYIGLISDEFSPDLIVKYLDRFLGHPRER
jgi:2-polyprenyl-6-methoxyphenol hydroxylase-like FAD-dependent oxidoreductase